MGHVRQMVRLRAERTITVRMLVDTGATYSVISPRLAKALGVAMLVGRVPEAILGVEALEGLGLVVDSRRKRLAPSRPYAVRLGGYR